MLLKSMVNPAAMDAPVSVTMSTLQPWMIQCQRHWTIHGYRLDSMYEVFGKDFKQFSTHQFTGSGSHDRVYFLYLYLYQIIQSMVSTKVRIHCTHKVYFKLVRQGLSLSETYIGPLNDSCYGRFDIIPVQIICRPYPGFWYFLYRFQSWSIVDQAKVPSRSPWGPLCPWSWWAVTPACRLAWQLPISPYQQPAPSPTGTPHC